MTILSLLLIVGRGRYRARLHLSVLDELPALLGNLFTASAIVATVIALRHEQDEVTTFLQNCAISILLVIAGREIVTQLIIWSRRHRVTAHPTVIIGGGALAAELARILQQHPRYGLTIVGFVEDGDDCPAAEFSPHLGATLDWTRWSGKRAPMSC